MKVMYLATGPGQGDRIRIDGVIYDVNESPYDISEEDYARLKLAARGGFEIMRPVPPPPQPKPQEEQKPPIDFDPIDDEPGEITTDKVPPERPTKKTKKAKE